MAYRVGAKLVFMDTIQYHPTGVSYPEQVAGFLVTEKVRSLGATPLNIDGEQFVYHLETRDVATSAIIRECARGKGVTSPSGSLGVWLDSPLIERIHGEGTIERELPAMFRQFARFDVDMRKDPLLIYPTLHYQNGGVLIADNGETSVENLYVAGEASGGVHGRNRLMGNSLMDILVFGRRAGLSAAQKVAGMKDFAPSLSIEHAKHFAEELEALGMTRTFTSPILLPFKHRLNPNLKPEHRK